MYPEDDLLPISAIQHLLFCERQCALIHVEQAWEENRLTAEGRILHDRVHDGGAESRRDVRTAAGVRIRSLRLGLAGQADVVELHRTGSVTDGNGRFVSVRLPSVPDWWSIFPVEYKRGKPKPDDCDKVQLCAQALCLEEMLGAVVSAGALFYGETRRRLDVEFTPDLRRETESAAARLHELVRAGVTPAAEYGKKCERCSLIDRCLPKAAGGRKSARRYVAEAIKEGLSGKARH
jgi:CRISPR-associated exonuclease Cas4